MLGLRWVLVPLVACCPRWARAVAESAVLPSIQEVNPRLVADDPLSLPMKVRGILVGEYEFFRGTADLFDRWFGVYCHDWLPPTSGHVRLHGDVHLGNMGTYQGPGELGNDIQFGLVDFDEAVVGPFQLDLLRAAVALRFAAAANGLAIDEPAWEDIHCALAVAYAHAFSEPAPPPRPERIPIAKEMIDKARGVALGKTARTFCTAQDPPRFRRVRLKGGRPADLMDPVDDVTRRRIVAGIASYWISAEGAAMRARFRFISADELCAAVLDVARWTRLGSSGSQGVRKYLVLLDRPLKVGEDRLILELKEQPCPAAARVGIVAAENGATRAAEVARAFPILQAPPVWLVGHATIDEVSFLIKTKDPWQEEPSVQDFASEQRIMDAAMLVGTLLGAAHRRSLGDAASSRPAEAPGLSDAATLIAELRRRSKAAEQHIRRQYLELRSDSRALELRDRAEARIAETVSADWGN